MFNLITVIAACATTYYLFEAKSDYDDLKAARKRKDEAVKSTMEKLQSEVAQNAAE